MNFGEDMKGVATRVSEKDLERMDRIINSGRYINRADFIREAIREKVRREMDV